MKYDDFDDLQPFENGEPFMPNPGLTDAVNNNIIQSEIDGGVYLKDLPVGSVLLVSTKNTQYRINKTGDQQYQIKGHERYCPNWTEAYIAGSTWGGSMLKLGFLGRGMHMEFGIDGSGVITTSKIQEIIEL